MPPLHLVDAFTSTAFAGNPAGVVQLATGPVDERWAQAVAAEVGASETAFVHPHDDGWRLRWWTPTVEVDLCGHATLATAHVLWQVGASPPDRALHFATRAGALAARRTADGRIALDLPAWPVADHPEPPALSRALAGAAYRYLGRTATDQANDLVELTDAAAVADLRPDLDAVAQLGSAGLIVTAAGDPHGGLDLVSRYFAPAAGIDEDPVTGSAHSTLGPLWAARLGRRSLRAAQLSSRGGRLELSVGDGRVEVTGHAVTVIEGTVVAPG